MTRSGSTEKSNLVSVELTIERVFWEVATESSPMTWIDDHPRD